MSGFDAHTHLDDPCWEGKLRAVADRARTAGVTGWAVVGSDPARWNRVLEVAAITGGIPVLGLHPWWVDRLSPQEVSTALHRLPELLTPFGLGETGLDHFTARTPVRRERQRRALRDQLALARERDLPVVLHCVRAWSELLGLLRADGLPRARGMVHGFTSSREVARALLDLGLVLGVGRAVMGPSGLRLRGVLAEVVPAEAIVLETDGPWPGGRGEPGDLLEVASAAASAYNCGVLTLLDQAGETARSLWRQR